MSAPLGVGVLGAGPVTRVIHLPTLATLHDRFRVVQLMDVDADVAATVAAGTGARSTTDGSSSTCWTTRRWTSSPSAARMSSRATTRWPR
jgi:predicted dehydrogenase